MEIQIKLNGKPVRASIDPDLLLGVLRGLPTLAD